MTADVQCPYCGEIVELILDSGGGSPQEYVEDCEVCCSPWAVRLTLRDGELESISVETAG